MKTNCKGCDQEFNDAYEYQEGGLYLVHSNITNLGVKGKHFNIIMVDNNGKIRVY